LNSRQLFDRQRTSAECRAQLRAEKAPPTRST
jgi:hypothetical protein